jgi:hypothetical protein
VVKFHRKLRPAYVSVVVSVDLHCIFHFIGGVKVVQLSDTGRALDNLRSNVQTRCTLNKFCGHRCCNFCMSAMVQQHLLRSCASRDRRL